MDTMTNTYVTSEAQRRANKKYRERLKQNNPVIYKAKIKQYNDTARENRAINFAEYMAEYNDTARENRARLHFAEYLGELEDERLREQYYGGWGNGNPNNIF